MNRMANRRDRKFSGLSHALAILALSLPVAARDLAVLRNGFTIAHDHRLVIGDKTRLFLSADDSNFTDVSTAEIMGYEKDLTLPAALESKPISPSKTPTADLNQVVNSASTAYHLDPDLVNSVIHAESGFKSHAVSPKGARGLMQLMPSTASALGVNDTFDPKDNVGGGSRYLRELLERYNFDLVKALAAYNAGPERVQHYNGVPPFHETRAYVARIIHEYNRKKIAQEKAAAQVQTTQAVQAGKKGSSGMQKKKAPSAAVAQTAPGVPKHSASSVTQLVSKTAADSPR
jgi:soluble lytic murein transglycosylase-like protein